MKLQPALGAHRSHQHKSCSAGKKQNSASLSLKNQEGKLSLSLSPECRKCSCLFQAWCRFKQSDHLILHEVGPDHAFIHD